MKIIKGDLVLTKDTVFRESIKVGGAILGKDGIGYNLEVRGNISAKNISAWDISAKNISAWDISAENISAGDISYYAFCIAYISIKCRKIIGRRENCFHKALDGKIIIEKGKK